MHAELAARGPLAPFRSVALRLGPTDEAAMAPALEALRSEFDGGVSVGSYPVRPVAPPAQRLQSLHRHRAGLLIGCRWVPASGCCAGVSACCAASSHEGAEGLGLCGLIVCSRPSAKPEVPLSAPAQVSGQADGAGLVLSLEGKDAGQLEAARARLARGLPAGTRLVSVQRDAASLDALNPVLGFEVAER